MNRAINLISPYVLSLITTSPCTDTNKHHQSLVPPEKPLTPSYHYENAIKELNLSHVVA